MDKTITLIFTCVTLLSCTIPQAVHAQDEGMASRGISETVDFITKLPSIFWSWVDEFDRVAEKEKRKQLVRKVDKLRKDLYRLELDKRFLLESIPDENPDVALIRQNIQDLEGTLEDLRVRSEISGLICAPDKVRR